MNGIVGSGLRIARGLGGVLRILRGAVRRALRLLDPGLRAIIHVVEVAIVGCGLLIELIGVIDQRRGLLLHVILGRAPGDTDQGQSRHAQPESSFHHLLESSRRLFHEGLIWLAGDVSATSVKMHLGGQTEYEP